MLATGRPVPAAEMRELRRICKSTLHEQLTVLTASAQLLRDDQSYRLGRCPLAPVTRGA